MRRTINIDDVINLMTIVQISTTCLGNVIPNASLLFYVVLGLNMALMFLNSRLNRICYSKSAVVILTLFILFCYCSARWALDSSQALRMANSLTKTFIMAFVYYSYYAQIEAGTEKMLKALMWAGVFVILFFIVYKGASTFLRLLKSGDRTDNSVINANGLGIIAAVSGITAFFYLKRGISVPLVLIFSISILIVAISGSKKAILLMIIGLFLPYMLNEYFESKRLLSLFKTIPVLVVGLVLVYFLLQTPVFSTIATRLESYLNSFIGGKKDASDLLRENMIKFGFSVFQQNKFRGIGIDNAKMINPYLPGYLHCNYVELLADVGLIGFVLYYSLYIGAFIGIIKRKNKDSYDAFILSLIIGMLLLDYGRVSYYDKYTYFMFVLYYLDSKRPHIVAVKDGANN